MEMMIVSLITAIPLTTMVIQSYLPRFSRIWRCQVPSWHFSGEIESNDEQKYQNIGSRQPVASGSRRSSRPGKDESGTVLQGRQRRQEGN